MSCGQYTSIIDGATNAGATSSVWKTPQAKQTPFYIQRYAYSVEGQLNTANRQSTFNLGRYGDLLWKMAFLIDMPAMSASYTAPSIGSGVDIVDDGLVDLAADEKLKRIRPYWQDSAPHALFSELRVKISQHVFDLSSGLDLDMLWEFSDARQRGFSGMVYKDLTVEQMQDASHRGFRATVFTRFWMGEEFDLAYPIVLHGTLQFTVDFKLNSLASLVVYPHGQQITVHNSNTSQNTQLTPLRAAELDSAFIRDSAIRLVTYQIYLSQVERQVFWDTACDYVFPQTQRVLNAVNLRQGTKNYEEVLSIGGATTVVRWALIRANKDSEFDTVSGHSWSGDESFATANFIVGQSRYNGTDLPAEWFRTAEPYAFGLNAPTNRYYVMSMCLDPKRRGKFSGSHAVGRADNCKISLSWACPEHPERPQSLQEEAYLYFFADGMNLLRVRKGAVGAKIQMF